MPLTDQDARALTFLARRLRTETHGCREWDDAGTYAKIAELIGQNLALSIERVLCHATDPEAKTPGAIGRPFLPLKPSDQPKASARPLKRTEQCTRCGGRKDGCYCRLEHLAAAYDDEDAAVEPVDKQTALDAARAALRSTSSEESDA